LRAKDASAIEQSRRKSHVPADADHRRLAQGRIAMARILVIDDDDLVRQTVEKMLCMAGHAVALAVDGVDGLRQFRQQAFDLVIADIFMPNKEGLETIRELRGMTSHTPIITMTGSAAGNNRAGVAGNVDYLRMAEAFGATRTISKPFSRHDLLALVDQCLAA
jgi:CheY-like chemotaxis protein